MGVLLNGLILGLSTGGYCIGACAPAMLPYVVSSGWRSPKVSARIVGEFLAGRLAAYMIFGTAVALLGRQVQASPVVQRGCAVMIIGLSILLFAHAITLNFPELKACSMLRRSAALRRFPFAAGLALGINVCPPMMLAFTNLLVLGRWLPCMGFCVAFFAGTAVFLVPLLLSGLLGRLAAIRGMSEAAEMFAGLWFLSQGVWLLARA